MRDLLEIIPSNNDRTFACNSARVATFLRPASENCHTFKLTYKSVGHRVHNSRLVAVGQAKLLHYNRLYGKNYPLEFAELPKVSLEYLAVAGRYNANHPKFFR